MTLLDIQNLHVTFATDAGLIHAVTGVSLTLAPGETLGLLGESGCGKSATAMSIPRLLPEPPAIIRADRMAFRGKDLLLATTRELRQMRGRDIGVIFQDPMTSLSPLVRIAPQIEEALLLHQPMPRREARRIALEWLARVGIDNPAQVALAYPHQLSGGMQQRVMVAIALANDPALIIADEPTTALDVTLQARILDLIGSLRKPGAALLLITHDVGVVAKMAARVAVMYAGQIVEEAPAAEFFKRPLHPYSAALLAAIPSLATRGKPLPAIPGQVPSPAAWPTGCRFAPRCSRATALCHEAAPELREVAPERKARCHLCETNGGRDSVEPGMGCSPVLLDIPTRGSTESRPPS
ncbi:MAG: ABC transporter ATP-binding protein [Kiritimatiellaeota bacterium]|nr:ABC transporter ATP-binding protein [Kiritimatiellota bacterium]